MEREEYAVYVEKPLICWIQAGGSWLLLLLLSVWLTVKLQAAAVHELYSTPVSTARDVPNTSFRPGYAACYPWIQVCAAVSKGRDG